MTKKTMGEFVTDVAPLTVLVMCVVVDDCHFQSARDNNG